MVLFFMIVGSPILNPNNVSLVEIFVFTFVRFFIFILLLFITLFWYVVIVLLFYHNANIRIIELILYLIMLKIPYLFYLE